MFGGSEGFPVLVARGQWVSLTVSCSLGCFPEPRARGPAGCKRPRSGSSQTLCTTQGLLWFLGYAVFRLGRVGSEALLGGLSRRGPGLGWPHQPSPLSCLPPVHHLGSHRDLEGSPLPSGRVVGVPWGVVLGTRVRSPAPVLGQLLGGQQGAGAGCSPSPGLHWGREGTGPFRPGHAACPAICPAHLSCHLPPPLLPFLELGQDCAAVTRNPSKVFLLPHLLPTWEARVMDPVLVTLNLLLFPRRIPEGP